MWQDGKALSFTTHGEEQLNERERERREREREKRERDTYKALT